MQEASNKEPVNSNLGDILQRSRGETDAALNAKEVAEQAERDRQSAIDQALRNMVSNKDLLKFLKARDKAVTLVEGKQKTVNAGKPLVEITGNGRIIISHRNWKDGSVRATDSYGLVDVNDPNSRVNSDQMEYLNRFVVDGKAFILKSTSSAISPKVGDFLAATYLGNDVLGTNITADHISRSLTAGVTELANK
ncbi:MAG: hypothetical protein ABH807_00630 [Candidatus Shapirobacteria bacterium]